MYMMDLNHRLARKLPRGVPLKRVSDGCELCGDPIFSGEETKIKQSESERYCLDTGTLIHRKCRY